MIFNLSTLGVVGLAAVASASPVEKRQPSGDFRQQMLDSHNFYRSQHGASNLSWNDAAAQNAQNWVNRCQFEHQSNNQYGENLAGGGGFTYWSDFVNMWGSERTKYDYNNPGFSGETGHFTQVVWKNTNSVGCAWKDCGSGSSARGIFVACEYAPPGNYLGQFDSQVSRQTSGSPTDTYHP